ncbi:hypothetical protein ASD15_22240 [Massilia sp. Root351]|uniref:hypothetical protein n=1 Tax=Massilia sp. Root351 TaxID=1736522 RepID=UPI00070B1600|nr:hypothetical protein [Massilia sp. Root351]KQV78529.1 hypothetical protein ASD15_22240 [Massilia sp. Root351]
MKQSTTHLHLLRNTLFFTRLERSQLQWVIAHSTEWEVQPGTEISKRLDAADHLWVLLDGGWQVAQRGRTYPAGHADSRLVATTHSYVMPIRRSDFDEMLKRGFDFDAHLRQGAAFYAGTAD